MVNARDRTFYESACDGYDGQFECALTETIIGAIAEASRVSDVNIIVFRTAETTSALVTVLAGMLAMSPATCRSPTAIRKTIDELHKRLRQRIALMRSDPGFDQFLRRCFHGNDVGGHG
jgi:hypothetical protein